MGAPPELRVGHILLEPGDPAEERPPRIWVAVGYEGKDVQTVKLRTAGFGEAETRKVQARRIPPGWLFVHSELLAGLLSRHAATFGPDGTPFDPDCQVCAVFGGPGTAETIQRAGH